ncbi:MAG: adenylate/guanylate cyclase domain-containing protein [Desulfobulbaceae bacterium]|nr:adenylate/guanylate cyclase domain-containing protein [Desulfobulbaceae bacterium]
MPIAIKLALAITLLIVTGMSLLGFIILEKQKTIMSQQVDAMGSTIAAQLANSAIEMVLADDTLGLQTLVNNLIDEDNILGAMIISEKGIVMAQGGTMPGVNIISSYPVKSEHPSDTQSFEPDQGPKADSVHELVTFVSPVHFNELLAGQAAVTFSKNAMVKSLHEAKNAVVITTAVMILVAILLAFILSKHLSKPIYNLVTACKAIGKGDFHYRLNKCRNDEIGELSLAFNQMADGLLKKSQVENIFSRYVSSSVAKKIMENLDQVELGSKHVNASVLFADIVGFTGFSETMPPQKVAGLLNEYFSYTSAISQHYHGHIDKFIGDCAMVVFGVPEHDPDHSFHAIACAVMIRKLANRLNTIRINCGMQPVQFRMGINTGNMVAGNLGSNDRMEYTVIGDSVNLASRLSSIAGSDQIVIMDELYKKESIRQRVVAHPHKTIRVHGRQLPVSTYLVDDIKAEYAPQMDTCIDAILMEYSTA